MRRLDCGRRIAVGGTNETRQTYDAGWRDDARQKASYAYDANAQARQTCQAGCKRQEMTIERMKGGYKVVSKKGKNLGGPYLSKEEAEKRLREVEFFKRKPK